MVDLCASIPDGIVAFFTSYSFLETVVVAWETMGVLSQISEKKVRVCKLSRKSQIYMSRCSRLPDQLHVPNSLPWLSQLIFIETKDVMETSLALTNYRNACDSGKGAVFFSVARGKGE